MKWVISKNYFSYHQKKKNNDNFTCSLRIIQKDYLIKKDIKDVNSSTFHLLKI